MRRRAYPLAVLLLLGAAPRVAAAQPAPEAPSAEATPEARARELVRRGLAASRAEQWTAALAAFEQAYALWPRPQVLFNLAAAQAQAGRLVDAAESYARFLREATDGPVAAHRPAALAALEQVTRRAARLRVSVRGAGPDDALALDGRALPRASWGAAVPLDPGAHAVVLTRGARELARAATTLREGELRELALSAPELVHGAALAAAPLVARAADAPVTAVGPTRRRATPPPSPARSPWLWAGVVLAVAGAAAVTTVAVVASLPPVGNLPPGRLFVE